MRYCIFCVIMLLFSAVGLTWSQTTGPSVEPQNMPPQPWPEQIHALAEALIDPSDPAVLSRLLPAGTSVRRFDRTAPDDRLSLSQTTAGAVVLVALGYPNTPDTLASDLSDHLREAEFIPELIRNQFIIESSAHVRHANDTAAQWVRTALQPGVEQPIGLIALWQHQVSAVATDQPEGRLIFILVKANRAPRHEHRIAQVIYGDTRQIIR